MTLLPSHLLLTQHSILITCPVFGVHYILQQDLAGQLNKSRDCKIDIYKDLKSKLLSQSQPSIDEDKRILALDIERLFTKLSELLKSGIGLHTTTINFSEDYDRLLKKAKVLFTTEQLIQELRESEYHKQHPDSLRRKDSPREAETTDSHTEVPAHRHNDQRTESIATAIETLKRFVDQLMVGGMITDPTGYQNKLAQKTEEFLGGSLPEDDIIHLVKGIKFISTHALSQVHITNKARFESLFDGREPTFRTEAVILVNFLAIKPHISLSQEL